ncbi:MAG: hypothetical protein H6972_05650 [Gammaproteobacteria bacterium]|nr:hypothetical protein [Gammaproteobacteria bacterium]
MTLTATPDVSSTFAGWSPAPCAASFAMPAQNLVCTAVFNLKTFTVNTGYYGDGGTITPSSQTVNYGDTAKFTIQPRYYDYRISAVTGCGGSLSGNTYTTGPITANCNVIVTWAALVATTSGSGGTISPSSQWVDLGKTTNFTVTAQTGYFALSSSFSTAGCSGNFSGNAQGGGTFTAGPIFTPCAITVTFYQLP